MRSNYFTLEEIEKYCRCAGVLLTRDDRGQAEILLVESFRKKYQYSFPKGKRNRDEGTLAAAKRELLEETGIDESRYAFVPGKWYIEFKQTCDKPHIVYYAARLLDRDVRLAPEDVKEIRSAGWFTPTNIYTMRTELYLQRRQIVTRAIRDLKMKKLLRDSSLPPPEGNVNKNFSAQMGNGKAATSTTPGRHASSVCSVRDPLCMHAAASIFACQPSGR